MLSGLQVSTKPVSSSTSGSANTITCDRMRPSACAHRCQKQSREPPIKWHRRRGLYIREHHRAMEFDRRWDTSEGCTNATALGSRRFCAKRAEIFFQITGATKAEQIRERIDTLSQEIRKQTTTETATATAPDLQRISDITGLDTQGVIGLRSLIVTVALDLLAAIMVVATSHSFLSSNMKAEQRSLQDRPPKPHERKEGGQDKE